MFAEEGNKTIIKYREDFNRYKAFLVKYGETDAIKLLVNKLNADIFQVYNNDTQDCVSSTIPRVGEEDLVAQALLNTQGTVSRITGQQLLTIWFWALKMNHPHPAILPKPHSQIAARWYPPSPTPQAQDFVLSPTPIHQ